MDNKSRKERSANMAAIRSENTKPEMIVRRLLFEVGFRYRLHSKKLPGKPDIVLSKWKTIVFVNGCFWHMHANCPRARLPTSNTAYWHLKLTRNQARDRRQYSTLIALGWRIIVVWECACQKNTLLSLQQALVRIIRKKDTPCFIEIGKSELEAPISFV